MFRSTIPLCSGSRRGSTTISQPSSPRNSANCRDSAGGRPKPAELPDPALVVPDQLPRDPAELLQQPPRAQHQVLRMPGRDHQPEHPPRVPRRHHQHRRHLIARGDRPVAQRDLRRREPEIVLRPLPRLIRRPARRILRQVQRPQLRDPLPQHRDRPLPADPLRDHRRRHRRAQRQLLPDRRLGLIDDRARSAHAGTAAPHQPAARSCTVFFETPSFRAIALIGSPSDLCRRRISAHSSKVITDPFCHAR